MDSIRQRSVLQAVLLTTLADHPDGLPIDEAYDAIDQNYRFPSEWYRQLPSDASAYSELAVLGIDDWRTVPQAQLVEMVSTEPQWQNEIRWARNDLRKAQYLDTTVARGIWRLSAAGMRAAQTVVTEGLSPEERKIVGSRRTSETRRSKRKPKGKAAGGERGRGLRHELVGRLELLTGSMPLSDLRLLVEITRAVRRRSLPEEPE
jgi:hypothetical protein